MRQHTKIAILLVLLLLLSACSDETPMSISAQREHIQSLMESGETDQAQKLAAQLARNNPEEPELLQFYGQVLLQAGKAGVAEGIFLQAEKSGVPRQTLLIDLGTALISQEKFREAVRLLKAPSVESDASLQLVALTAAAELDAPGYDEDEQFKTALRLYKMLANTELAGHQETQSWLNLKRAAHPTVDAAFQHYDCRTQPIHSVDSSDHKVSSANPESRILQVGPERKLKTPSAAARVAKNGDIIEIDAGVYAGDVAVWKQNDLTLRGVGGLAHMQSNGATAQDKGIWFFEGNNNTVEYIEFSGARAKHRNGSGIRLHGAGLTVRHSFFHDNEDGILGGYGKDSEVLVEYSEFARNGYGDGQSHNIYIGQIGTFTLRYSYSHHAKIGHLVKSRARNNFILYNRLLDESTGNASYLVDIPEGGHAIIIGNEMHKGPRSQNPVMISFAAERQDRPDPLLFVVHNTFHNQYAETVFVKNYTETDAQLINNLFAGASGVFLQGPGRVDGFMAQGMLGLNNPSEYDYSLTKDSPAIDAGVRLPNSVDPDLLPSAEYVHRLSARKRQRVWLPDIGAHEFCGL